MRKTIIICLGYALLTAACSTRAVDSDGQVKDDIADELQTGKKAANTAILKFCACAADRQSDVCKKSPAMCFENKTKCIEALLVNPYQVYDAQTTGCLIKAYNLSTAASLSYLKCFHKAHGLYSECMDRVVGCGHDAVIRCSSTNWQKAVNKCPVLPAQVVSAVNACTGAHDSGL